MIMECAYCGWRIRTSEEVPGVSHGICHGCLPEALNEFSLSVKDYLEAVPYPALLVDEQGRPVAVNSLYRDQIGSNAETGVTFVENLFDPPNGTEKRFKKTDTVRMKVLSPANSEVGDVRGSAEICRGDRHRRLNMLLGLMKMGSDTIVEIKDMDETSM